MQANDGFKKFIADTSQKMSLQDIRSHALRGFGATTMYVDVPLGAGISYAWVGHWDSESASLGEPADVLVVTAAVQDLDAVLLDRLNLGGPDAWTRTSALLTFNSSKGADPIEVWQVDNLRTVAIGIDNSMAVVVLAQNERIPLSAQSVEFVRNPAPLIAKWAEAASTGLGTS